MNQLHIKSKITLNVDNGNKTSHIIENCLKNIVVLGWIKL